jgi:hypothetical protein
MSHDYNNRYVGPALDLLMEGLRPFVEEQFQAYYGNNWRTEITQALRQDAESRHLMAAVRSDTGRPYDGARAGYGAGGFNEPVPQQGEPQGVLRSGDVAVRIDGELVPVVDVALGALGGREGGCA